MWLGGELDNFPTPSLEHPYLSITEYDVVHIKALI